MYCSQLDEDLVKDGEKENQDGGGCPGKVGKKIEITKEIEIDAKVLENR